MSTSPTPYGLGSVENCLTCELKADRFFCNLQGEALEAFNAINFATTYPAGAVLYVEGENPRGVYMLCQGQVKLSTTSSTGKTLITRLVGPGEVLGMSATISERPFKATAETTQPSVVNFIRKDDFLRFLREFSDACLRAAQQLSDECMSATDHVRSLGLSGSASEKFANLILSWADEQASQGSDGIRVKQLMTHQEIAQMIGASRETVTRLFSEYKQKKILSVKGSTVIIHNRPALEALVML